ncbi:MAG: HD-GYP domain-containing protein [Actinobacteria bacterium]|nr:MAG: HD-GYP domain-containing protein [Actinomycetota bacterium]
MSEQGETGRQANNLLGRKDRVQRVKNSVRMLAVAQREVALYPSSHPSVLGAIRELHESLTYLLQRVDHLTFNVYRGILFLEDEVMPDETARHHGLVERLVAMGIGSMTFVPGLSEDELIAFVELVGSGEEIALGQVKETLSRAGSAHIRLYEKSSLMGDEDAEGPSDNAAAKKVYSSTIEAVRRLEANAKLGKTLDLVPLQNLVNQLLEELLRDRATMIALASIKSHDEYTLQHSVNVCVLATALGSLLSIAKDPLRNLGLCALTYDIGKIHVPTEILKKGSPLTREEWQLIMSHSVQGAELLKKLHPSTIFPMVTAFEHHMRYDLQGYPKPPSNEKIHIFSRIVAICDAYDAMTTRRPYRRAIRPEQTVAILMQGRGRAYDPGITKAFVNMLGIYPTSSLVKLSSGEVGAVMKANPKDVLHPKVAVLFDRHGRRFLPEERRTIDLADRDGDGRHKRSIVDTLDADEYEIDMAELV